MISNKFSEFENSTFTYDLIQSMSKNEKIFFKKYAQLHTIGDKNIYVDLYDEMLHCKLYNEEEVFKKVKGIKSKNNFLVTKDYLKNQLLNSLSHYHSDKSIQGQLSKEYEQCSFLIKRLFNDQAIKKIKKAISIANKYEFFEYQIAFMELLFLVKLNTTNKKDVIDLDQMMQDFQIINTKKENLNKAKFFYYNFLKLRLEDVSFKDYNNKEQSFQLLEKTMFLKKEADKSNDFFLKVHVYAMFLFTHNHYKEYSKGIDFAEILIDTWRSKLYFIKENYLLFLQHLDMITETYLLSFKFDEIIDLLNNSNYHIKNNLNELAFYKIMRWNRLMYSYNNKFQVEKNLPILKEIKNEMNQYTSYVNFKKNKNTYVNASIASFVLKKYDDAYYFFNQSITFFSTQYKSREDAAFFLLSIMFVYEMKNEIIFHSQYQKVQNYLIKTNYFGVFEKYYLNFFKELFYLNNKTKQRLLIEKALPEFIKERDSKNRNFVFSYFVLVDWIESKIKGKDYIAYRIEKSQKK